MARLRFLLCDAVSNCELDESSGPSGQPVNKRFTIYANIISALLSVFIFVFDNLKSIQNY